MLHTSAPRRVTRVMLVRALVGTLVAGLAASAFALSDGPAVARRGAAPGSAGIGDSYFPKDGNGGYDVGHYAVHDSYRFTSGRLSGHTVLSARATQNLSSFHLDLMLTPDAVTVDGRPARFRKASRHELVVTPRAAVADGRTFRVRVAYHGVPKKLTWDGARPWNANRHEVMATNEPQIAPWWFAADDHPRDKAAFDISVRVRSGHQVVSNGRLVSKDVGRRWSTWHWQMLRPMAPYLAFFGAGHFHVERGRSSGLPYTIAVSRRLSPSDQAAALRLLRKSAPITAWLAGRFGRYPFGSTGGVATSLFTGFALENQSRPTYDLYGLDHTTEVHELAHQWFGDDVSVERWRDIWLNEGFASFIEWLYSEHHGGYRAQRQLRDTYDVYGARNAFWKRVIADPGPKHVFSDPVYERGAMTLQALRHRIGEHDFAVLLRTWVRQHAGGTARTSDFEALAGTVSGQQLGGFFDAWLHSGTKPARTAANGLG